MREATSKGRKLVQLHQHGKNMAYLQLHLPAELVKAFRFTKDSVVELVWDAEKGVIVIRPAEIDKYVESVLKEANVL